MGQVQAVTPEEVQEPEDIDEENARLGALIDALIACLPLETEEEKVRTKILIKALEAAQTIEA